MGQERFAGESAQNFEQKCLCVLVMDVSGSMSGAPINSLNAALKNFWSDILNDNDVAESLKDQLEIAVIQFDEEVKLLRNPALLEIEEAAPTLVERGSTTNTVDALREAIKLVDDRKEFYKSTGQPYYRPWIVLMTDGEPYPASEGDIAAISATIQRDCQAKKYTIIGLGVEGFNRAVLEKMTGQVLPLDGAKFKEFFSWLSNSMSTISQSKSGDKVDLSSGISDFAAFSI